MAADTSVSIARRQQGEYSVAWVEKLFFMMKCWGWVHESQPDERSCSLVHFRGSGCFCISCQTAAGGNRLWLGWKNYFLWWNVGGEFRSPTAWGERLLSSPVVWQWILLYLFPEGSSVNRLWRMLSFGIFWALTENNSNILRISKNLSVIYEKISVTTAIFTPLVQNILFVLCWYTLN